MDLVDLRYFQNTARAGGFAAGARRSHISPPAMTKAIRRLEGDLGVALFVRSTRRVALTDAGRTVLARADEILRLADTLRHEVVESAGDVRGEIRIAAMEVFSIYLLPLALARLVRRHPEVTPLVYEMIPQKMETLLREGEIDVGFTVGVDVARESGAVSLGSSPGRVVCGRGHPLFGQGRGGRIRRSDLAVHPFVVPRFFGMEHLPVIDRFPDATSPRRVGATIELLQMGVQLVLAGSYLGYFPEISVRHHIEAGSLRVLRGLAPGPPFDLVVLLPPGTRGRPAVLALVEEMKGVVGRTLRGKGRARGSS